MKTLLTATFALSMLAAPVLAQTAIDNNTGLSQQEILRNKSTQDQSQFSGESRGDGVKGADGDTTTTLGGQGTGAGAGMGGNQVGVDGSATGSVAGDGAMQGESNFNGQSTNEETIKGADGDTTNTTGGAGTGGGTSPAQ